MQHCRDPFKTQIHTLCQCPEAPMAEAVAAVTTRLENEKNKKSVVVILPGGELLKGFLLVATAHTLRRGAKATDSSQGQDGRSSGIGGRRKSGPGSIRGLEKGV